VLEQLDLKPANDNKDDAEESDDIEEVAAMLHTQNSYVKKRSLKQKRKEQ
jgi:hypothetical protein